jgi:flavin reductase (DIM6/NTAB) family NADH-FMN oxidoreductase RutF
MKTIAPQDLPFSVFHSYLLGSIAPRPIAFASTIDARGRVNLSPFSFFNVFGANPATLIFSPNNGGRDNKPKNTLENVLEVPEVVINMVDYRMVEQMSLASGAYERGVNEFMKAGFTEQPSLKVRPPRVHESPAQFECVVKEVNHINKGAGGAPNLVVCEVILAHFADELLDAEGKIDPLQTDWVGRMGGNYYVRASGDALFEVARPTRGVGFEQLPPSVRNSSVLTGNDLGKLASVERIPTAADAPTFLGELIAGLDDTQKHQLAKQYLDEGRVQEAWLTLLSAPKR